MATPKTSEQISTEPHIGTLHGIFLSLSDIKSQTSATAFSPPPPLCSQHGGRWAWAVSSVPHPAFQPLWVNHLGTQSALHFVIVVSQNVLMHVLLVSHLFKWTAPRGKNTPESASSGLNKVGVKTHKQRLIWHKARNIAQITTTVFHLQRKHSTHIFSFRLLQLCLFWFQSRITPPSAVGAKCSCTPLEQIKAMGPYYARLGVSSLVACWF